MCVMQQGCGMTNSFYDIVGLTKFTLKADQYWALVQNPHGTYRIYVLEVYLRRCSTSKRFI